MPRQQQRKARASRGQLCSVFFPYYGILLQPHTALVLSPCSAINYENLGKFLDLVEPLYNGDNTITTGCCEV